ncbi:MAG: LuxR C-terminal-related transcriptional regulator [Oscillospiraceae bacterium]|nr:LuxR C-terminal-related transcriptional regulator [Oscillospiraceae bacterium]
MRISYKDRTNDYDKLHYIRPEEAGLKWMRAKNNNQTLYIYGMSGYGKTSLINSMTGKTECIYVSGETVEPDDLIIPVSARIKTVIVDDIHYLPDNIYFEECLEKISEAASRNDIWLVLSGRCKIPSWLIRLHMNRVFLEIDENMLCLSDKEITKAFKSWGLEFTSDECKKYSALTKHQGLAVRAFSIHALKSKEINDNMIENVRNELWEYAWYHVYEKWDTDLLETVMKLSIIEKFDEEMARIITGCSNISGYIEKMQLIGNYLECVYVKNYDGSMKPVYSIHPSVRRSMIYCMKKYMSKGETEKAYYNAGLYFEMTNQPLKALEYYRKSDVRSQIASVLIKNSKQNPGSGYYFELRKYYYSLDDKVILESPELMSGMSMLSSMLLNTSESERWYQQLKIYSENNTGSNARTAKKLLLVLDITLPHRGIENMAQILSKAGTLVLSRKLLLPELAVTSNQPSQMNGGKDFCDWSLKDRELAGSIGKILSVVLGRYGKALVNLALAESFFEKGEDSFEISSLLATGRMQADSVNNMEQIFVSDAVLAKLYITVDKRSQAIEHMKSFLNRCICEKKTRLIPNVKTFIVRLQLYAGDTAAADKWLETAPNENDEFITIDRLHYLTKVRIYIINGKYNEAQTLLQRLMYYAGIMHRTYIKIECLLLMAVLRYRMGEKDYDEFFSQCMTIAEKYHFVRIISLEGCAARPLLAHTKWQPENKVFFLRVRSETEKISKCYPAYMKKSKENISFSENAINILRLQAEGYPLNDIALKLGLKLQNVKYHCRQNYIKLGVKGKAGAVVEAKRKGII